MDRPHLRDIGHVAVDTETTSLDEMRAELVGISLCVDAGTGLLYSAWATSKAAAICSARTDLCEGQMPLDEALAMLNPCWKMPAS